MSASTRPFLRFIGCYILTAMVACIPCAMVGQDTSTAPANAVPQGTTCLIQLATRLDTHTAKAGDRFEARLAEPMVAGNGQTLDAGSQIRGHISAVEPGFRRRLLLSFDEIQTLRGWVSLIATVTGVPGEHGLSRIGDEGEIGRKGVTKEQIAEAVVVAAGEGAVEGEKNGGKRGAATGAGQGAADGAMSAFESGHDLVLEKGTALEIRLDRSLSIPSR
jgi:hypothetical protein